MVVTFRLPLFESHELHPLCPGYRSRDNVQVSVTIMHIVNCSIIKVYMIIMITFC